MTPREKLIEKVAEVFYNSEEYNSTYGYPDSSFEEDKKDEANECVRRRVYVAKTIAKNIIDFLQIQPDKFGDVRFNIYHVLDEEPEKTLEEAVKEIQQFVEEKGIEFPSHEELLKMRED